MNIRLVPDFKRGNFALVVLGDFLREKIEPSSELSFVTAYFTIYGYAALREELEQIERLRLLFGEPRFIREVDPDKSAGKQFLIDSSGLRIANQLSQRAIARVSKEQPLQLFTRGHARVFVLGFGEAKDESWATPQVRRAFEASSDLWLEVSHDPGSEPDAAAKREQLTHNPDGRSFFDVLEPAVRVRARLVESFDQFFDVASRSDADVAQLIRDNKVHIAVDLKGYTTDSRIGILAQRAAPIQVSYMGFPASTGADFINYVIADRIVLPLLRQVVTPWSSASTRSNSSLCSSVMPQSLKW